MTASRRELVCALALVSLLAAPARAGGPASKDKKLVVLSDKQAKQAPAVQPVRLHFDVIELMLTDQQIQLINNSVTAPDLRAIAAEGVQAGNARVRHAFDSLLVVGEEVKLVTGARVPLLRGVSHSETGHRRSEVTYENVGCMLVCDSHWAGPPEDALLRLSLDVELSTLGRDRSVPLTNDLLAPVFQTVEQNFEAVVRLGKETYFAMLSAPTAEGGEPGTAQVYLYRMRFEPVEP